MTSSLFFIFSHFILACSRSLSLSVSASLSLLPAHFLSLSLFTMSIRTALLTGSSQLFVLVWHRECVSPSLFRFGQDADRMPHVETVWN